MSTKLFIIETLTSVGVSDLTENYSFVVKMRSRVFITNESERKLSIFQMAKIQNTCINIKRNFKNLCDASK